MPIAGSLWQTLESPMNARRLTLRGTATLAACGAPKEEPDTDGT